VDGNSLVGHGGSCPGYLTSLTMDTRKKLAVVVMVNGQGESLNKYSNAIFNILKKAAQLDLTANDTADLRVYTGNYDSYAFGSEVVVFKWKGKLAVVNLRSNDPASDMSLLKHISGDTFRRIRSDDTLGEEIRFERDSNGKVVRVWQFSNFDNKISD